MIYSKMTLSNQKYSIKHQFEYSYLYSVTLKDTTLLIENYNPKFVLTKFSVTGKASDLQTFTKKLIHLYNCTTIGEFKYEPPAHKAVTNAIQIHSSKRGLNSPYRITREGLLTVNSVKDLSCTVKQGLFIYVEKKERS